MRTNIIYLLTAGIVCLSGVAAASEVKSLLHAAFDAPDGRARGYLSGPAAEPFRIMTMGEAPTELTVHVIDRNEGDCGRVRFSFMQPDALRRDGRRERLDYHMDMNVCRDGAPYVPPEMRDGPRALRVADSEMRPPQTVVAPRADIPPARQLAKPVNAGKPVASDRRSASRNRQRQPEMKPATKKQANR